MIFLASFLHSEYMTHNQYHSYYLNTNNISNYLPKTYTKNDVFAHLNKNHTEIIHYNTRKRNNKMQHIKNGNYHLNILHWNKGNTLFTNKITHIDQIMDKYRPHIISLCEANIEKMVNNTLNDRHT